MSLRIRLILLIGVLVALVAVALSALHLDSLVDSLSTQALDRSVQAGQQVSTFVADHINQLPEQFKNRDNLAETVAGDPDISSMLERAVALSQAIVEINVASQEGVILVSSNPPRTGEKLASLQAFSTWINGRFYRRLLDLVERRRPDYQVTSQLGIGGQPIFTIQVVTSNVLLRDALFPDVRTLAEVSGGALLVSLVLTVLATNRVLRPLKRIEQTIDRIAQGTYRDDESNEMLATEFAALESKLNLLGQKFRGAREEASEMRHNLEELLERMASQLDVASRLSAISRITGGVAHEIKNPLNAISLRLELLRARLGAPEEELGAELDILLKEVTRLDRVVKTFLDFSRPVEVRFQEVDLESLAREVADLMTPQSRLAGIVLQFERAGAGGPPLRIRGDADMLKQAVLNLVTNALEAMKGGGHLSMSVARTGDAVKLDVADDGPGIPPGLREKVFHLYFTTKPAGSGIGLAMTYRTVQLHNGTIDFTSEDGRGTTFHLQFPAIAGHA
jgi:signal transduction histidine kinase